MKHIIKLNESDLKHIITEAIRLVGENQEYKHSSVGYDTFGLGQRVKYNKFDFMKPHVCGSKDLKGTRDFIENSTETLLKWLKEHPGETLDYEKARKIVGTRHSELKNDLLDIFMS